MARYQGNLVYADADAGLQFFQGWVQNKPCIIKEQTFFTLAEAQSARLEAMNISRLRHLHICQIYECSLSQDEYGSPKTVLLREYAGSDLLKEIEKRKALNIAWTEDELFDLLRAMVSALSYAENMGINHQDIQPMHILLMDGCYKLGEFGSSSNRFGVNRMGTTDPERQLFLSPESKQAYVKMCYSGQLMQYDLGKSDVYSLGVTLLYMAYMQPPMELAGFEGLENIVNLLLKGLRQYPRIQFYLSLMLASQPEERPNFYELERYFQFQEIGFYYSEQSQMPGYSYWHTVSEVQSVNQVSSSVQMQWGVSSMPAFPQVQQGLVNSYLDLGGASLPATQPMNQRHSNSQTSWEGVSMPAVSTSHMQQPYPHSSNMNSFQGAVQGQFPRQSRPSPLTKTCVKCGRRFALDVWRPDAKVCSRICYNQQQQKQGPMSCVVCHGYIANQNWVMYLDSSSASQSSATDCCSRQCFDTLRRTCEKTIRVRSATSNSHPMAAAPQGLEEVDQLFENARQWISQSQDRVDLVVAGKQVWKAISRFL